MLEFAYKVTDTKTDTHTHWPGWQWGRCVPTGHSQVSTPLMLTHVAWLRHWLLLAHWPSVGTGHEKQKHSVGMTNMLDTPVTKMWSWTLHGSHMDDFYWLFNRYYQQFHYNWTASESVQTTNYWLIDSTVDKTHTWMTLEKERIIIAYSLFDIPEVSQRRYNKLNKNDTWKLMLITNRYGRWYVKRKKNTYLLLTVHSLHQLLSFVLEDVDQCLFYLLPTRID